MNSRRLEHRYEQRVWGRDMLPAWAEAQPLPGAPIGEIWFVEDGDVPAELLVKYLFTSERLSIQVHPDDVAACAIGLPRGKDEAWLVLEAAPDAVIGLGLKHEVSKDELRAAAVDGSIERLIDWRPVSAGDFFYSPAGTIHAIGPGLSLMSEFLGFAYFTELPAVLFDVQRVGPSTGMPTKPEQADLLMVMFGRNSESPVPVVAAPADDVAPVEVTVQGISDAERLRQSAEAVKVVETKRASRESADMAEVLARTQGVGVRRSGGLGSGTRFSLNGLTDEQIHFFIDGVPLDLAGYPFGVSNVPVHGVQRVEIYAGVVPIRLGADALGGAEALGEALASGGSSEPPERRRKPMNLRTTVVPSPSTTRMGPMGERMRSPQARVAPPRPQPRPNHLPSQIADHWSST